MRKFLPILALILLLPFAAQANIATPWLATSTDAGYIQPTPINGNNPYLKILSIGTSTFSNGVNLTTGCFSVGGICIGGGVSSFNTRTGAVTLNSSDVTTALGFTPYNATNPSGYISNITGLLNAGTNITITGTGTSGSPYVINSSGGTGSAYPFGLTGNATSTLTQFNGGLTAYASSTIGNGGANGLTINGNATTTGQIILTNDGSVSAPSIFWSDMPNTGIYKSTSNILDFAVTGSDIQRISSNGEFMLGASYTVSSNTTFQWSSGVAGSAGVDTGLSRLGAAKVGIGNGTNGNVSGTLIAANIGIGTTSPYQNLSVAGNEVVTGNVTWPSFTGTQCLHEVNGLVGVTGSDCGSGSGVNYLTNSGANTYLNTGTNLEAPTFTATSTTAASFFPYASSTSFSTTGSAVIGGNFQANGNTAYGGTAVASNEVLAIGNNVNDPATNYTAISAGKTIVLSAPNAQQVIGVSGNVALSANAFNDTGVLAGGYFQGDNSNTATVNTLTGVDGLIYNVGAGTITNAYAVQANIQNLNTAGKITNGYYYYAGGGFNNSTISNLYGLYIDNLPAATSTWGVYENSTANNYFKGNVGIGSTTPGSLLSLGSTNGINFSTATSTFNSTGGLNLISGCYAVNGTCLSTGSTYTAGTGLTLTGGAFSVNTTQNITTLSNLTTAGFVQTTSGGLLSSAALTSGQVTTALGFTPYNSTNPSGYTSNTGTVTSVSETVPSFLSISGSPITTSGTLAIGFSGTALPLANGGTGLTSIGASSTVLVSNGTVASWQTPAASGYSPIGTTGQFPYFSASNTLTATSSLYLAANSSVGIGTTTPGSIVSIQGVANFVASGLSTIYNGLSILGNLFLPSLGTPAGSFLAVTPTGQVISTSTPSVASSTTPYFGTNSGQITIGIPVVKGDIVQMQANLSNTGGNCAVGTGSGSASYAAGAATTTFMNIGGGGPDCPMQAFVQVTATTTGTFYLTALPGAGFNVASVMATKYH